MRVRVSCLCFWVGGVGYLVMMEIRGYIKDFPELRCNLGSIKMNEL